MSRRLVARMFGKVEVAVVEVAVKYSETVSPTTESFAYGDVVPIPTFPVESIRSASNKEPEIFLIENERADAGVDTDVFVKIEAI